MIDIFDPRNPAFATQLRIMQRPRLSPIQHGCVYFSSHWQQARSPH
jgi:hypothetical protein